MGNLQKLGFLHTLKVLFHILKNNCRQDIKSFGFDLGGSTCACLLQWDIQQYWQRVFYGKKYVVFHCTTGFFGVLFLHRPQWVLIWKILNEVLEELKNAIVGRWAWTVSVLDMESRYDTLINDILLTAIPFSALGHGCVCFITAGPITKLCAWGEEESGGHVL
jgi:hypothetical protein